MNEIDYGSVFGVEGANESAPARQTDEQAEDSTAAAANTEPEAGAKETVPAEQSGDGKQSAAENAKFAAARRKAEQERDAAIARALQQERARSNAEWTDFFAKANLKNTITGAPITNMQEFRQWEEAYSAAKLEQDLKAGKLTSDTLNDAITRNETVRQMQQLVAHEKAATEAARQQQQKMVLDEQIKEIAKLDPNISTVQDLLDLPEYNQVYNLVRKGNSIVDAFKLVFFDKLKADAGNAGRQAALNAAGSKEHLTATTARGAGSLTVPADVKQMYKAMMPDATDAEIQEHYNRFHKRN